MKISRTIGSILIILISLFICGCNKGPQDVPVPAQDIEEAGEIIDPVELEKLWQEYLYDSITTIGNAGEFSDPREIDPLQIAMFAWFKYAAEHGSDSLELAEEGSSLRLMPMTIVLEYAEKYFNLTGLDTSQLEGDSFDPKRQSFVFGFGSESPRPGYKDPNPWGIHLDKTTRNNDGTITAALIHYDSYQTKRIQRIRTYTLKPREDGSLYFANGRWDYIDNHLVSLTGNFTRFDKISGFDGNMAELSMIGEIEGKMLLAYIPYENGKNFSLMLVDPENMKAEKRFELQNNVELTGVRLKADKIILCLNDRITYLDKDLGEVKNVLLPQAITAKIHREPKYDQNGMPDVFFGGYDITEDLQKIVYADEIGLKLLNLAGGSEKLLSESIPVKDSRLIDFSFHRFPRFVAGEEKVITTMTDYEGTMGYTMCNLETGASEIYKISSEGSSTGLIRYDTGILEVNTYIDGAYKTLYLDFKTESLKEINLGAGGETGDIRPSDYCYVGKDYAAFVTYTWDSNDNAQNMTYIHRLNLETLQAESSLVSIKAAQVHILGVMADGRIIFSYDFYPNENGLCITK